MPLPLVGGTSVETTVRVNGVSTCPMMKAAACAFGSRQGFAGVGFGFDGQSNGAWAVALVPGVNGRGSACGGGTNDAVTACAEFIVTLQPAVPEQACSHPPKVEGCVAAAVSETTVPTG